MQRQQVDEVQQTNAESAAENPSVVEFSLHAHLASLLLCFMFLVCPLLCRSLCFFFDVRLSQLNKRLLPTYLSYYVFQVLQGYGQISPAPLSPRTFLIQ